jgi:hypothetical protein
LTDHVFLQITQHVKTSNSFYCVYSTYPEKSKKRWSLREARLRPPCIYSRAFDLSDGTNVNHRLVKDGWCWWYQKYAPGDTVLEGLEKEARESKKGLWIDPAPLPPWVYHKTRRGHSKDLSDLVPLDTETEGNAVLVVVGRPILMPQ